MSASETELDMYRELANIGSGNAATAASQMLNTKVDIGLPRSAELTLSDIEQIVGDPAGDDPVAVVVITVFDELAGTMALVIDEPERVCEVLAVPNEFFESALAEIGNIMASRFLISVGQMVGLDGEVDPPAVGFAPRNAALETVVALAAQAEPFYVLRTDLLFGDERSHNEMLYFPNEPTIERLRGLL